MDKPPKQRQLLKRDANWDANWDVIWDAIWDANWDSNWDINWDTNRDANWDINWDANWDINWDVNWDVNQHPKQRQLLKRDANNAIKNTIPWKSIQFVQKMMKNTLKVIMDTKREAKRDANHRFCCSVDQLACYQSHESIF